MTEILVSHDGAVMTVTFNRPAALNAFNVPLIEQLGNALADARDSSVRAVVLTGAGRAFSAGQDLRELIDDPPASYEDVHARYIPLILAVKRLPKPVIAALNGVAAGGALGLAMACDLRVAATGAVLDPGFARVGLVPDSGLTYTLPRLLGPGRAFELLALSSRVTAEEALGLGLVNRVWPGETFATEVAGYARRLAEGPTFAHALLKEAMAVTWDQTFEESLRLEGRLQGKAGASADHREGIAAFTGRRPAGFEGR